MGLHEDLEAGEVGHLAGWRSYFLRQYVDLVERELANPRMPLLDSWRAELERCIGVARAELARRGEEMAR